MICTIMFYVMSALVLLLRLHCLLFELEVILWIFPLKTKSVQGDLEHLHHVWKRLKVAGDI